MLVPRIQSAGPALVPAQDRQFENDLRTGFNPVFNCLYTSVLVRGLHHFRIDGRFLRAHFLARRSLCRCQNIGSRRAVPKRWRPPPLLLLQKNVWSMVPPTSARPTKTAELRPLFLLGSPIDSSFYSTTRTIDSLNQFRYLFRACSPIRRQLRLRSPRRPVRTRSALSLGHPRQPLMPPRYRPAELAATPAADGVS